MVKIIKKKYVGERIYADPAAALLFLDFVENEQLEKYQQILPSFITREKTRIIDGPVGAAYERFEAVRLCEKNNLSPDIRELSDLLKEKMYPARSEENYQPDYDFCAAAFRFPPLGGMTSHLDYSFNRDMLGSLLVTGKIIFGVGQERDQAYENGVLMHPGNLMVLNAPQQKDSRPYFSVFCPEESIVIRTWIRPAEKCKFGGG